MALVAEVYSKNSFEIGQIDRAVFELLRLGLVSAGVLPDQTTMTNSAYQTAKNGLGNNLVELYGVGNYQAKGKLRLNRIIIERISEREGTVRGFSEFDYRANNEGSFVKQRLPRHTTTINYQIRLLTDSIVKERQMDKIIKKAIPLSVHTAGRNEDGSPTQNKFILERGQSVTLSTEPDWIEKIYQIEVKDVFLEEKQDLETIAPIEQITVTIEANQP